MNFDALFFACAKVVPKNFWNFSQVTTYALLLKIRLIVVDYMEIVFQSIFSKYSDKGFKS